MKLALYLYRKFGLTWAGCEAALLAVLFFAHLMEKLGVFLKLLPLGRTPSDFLLYMAWNFPDWIVYTLPLSFLLATLLTLTGLAKSRELMAMYASGISPGRIAGYFLMLAGATSLFLFFYNEGWVYRANRKKRQVWHDRIFPREPRQAAEARFVVRQGGRDRLYMIRRVQEKKPDGAEAEEVRVYWFGPENRMERWWKASRVELRQDRWLLEGREGWTSPGSAAGEMAPENLSAAASLALPEKPSDFLGRRLMPDEHSFWELRDLLRRLRRTGQSVLREEVALYHKTALPAACLILVWCALPFGLRHEGGHRTKQFGLVLLVAFLYWIGMAAGKALGGGGYLPPVVSAWLPNLLFLALGVEFWRRFPAGDFFSSSK